MIIMTVHGAVVPGVIPATAMVAILATGTAVIPAMAMVAILATGMAVIPATAMVDILAMVAIPAMVAVIPAMAMQHRQHQPPHRRSNLQSLPVQRLS